MKPLQVLCFCASRKCGKFPAAGPLSRNASSLRDHSGLSLGETSSEKLYITIEKVKFFFNPIHRPTRILQLSPCTDSVRMSKGTHSLRFISVKSLAHSTNVSVSSLHYKHMLPVQSEVLPVLYLLH